MPFCRDPFVTLINSFDFNAVRVPRTDYVPGSVLARSRNGTVSLLGAFNDVFKVLGDEALTVSEAGAGEVFEGANTAAYRVNVAAKLLSEWLAVAQPSLASGFRGAKRISYQIQQTRLLTTPVISLRRLLATADSTSLLLNMESAHLFVISEVLQAKALRMVAKSDVAGTAALDASLLPEPVTSGTATFALDAEKAASGVLRFTFTTYHTVGFKAHEVEIADGEYALVPTGKRGLSHLDATEEEYRPVLFDGEPLL